MLTYDTHTQRYRYYQLIKEFFAFEFKENELLIQKEIFFWYFEEYYVEIGGSCKNKLREWFDSIDEECPNYDFLISCSLEKCPDDAEFVIKSLAEISFKLTKHIIDALHLCKLISIRSRNPL